VLKPLRFPCVLTASLANHAPVGSFQTVLLIFFLYTKKTCDRIFTNRNNKADVENWLGVVVLNKKLFNKLAMLAIINCFISFFTLLIFKLFKDDFTIYSFIHWMQIDTKKAAFYLLILFIVSISTVKVQMRIYYKLKAQNPWFLALLKHCPILVFFIGLSISMNYYLQYFQFLKNPQQFQMNHSPMKFLII
jgi:hypothetical protein